MVQDFLRGGRNSVVADRGARLRRRGRRRNEGAFAGGSGAFAESHGRVRNALRRPHPWSVTYCVPPPSDSFSITLSRLKDAASCRGGYSANVERNCADIGLRRHQHEGAVEHPVVVGVRRAVAALVGVAAQVEDERHAQRRQRLHPGAEGGPFLLLEEGDLPVAIAQRHQVAVVGEVEDLVARALVGLAGQHRQDVVAVEMHAVVAAAISSTVTPSSRSSLMVSLPAAARKVGSQSM